MAKWKSLTLMQDNGATMPEITNDTMLALEISLRCLRKKRRKRLQKVVGALLKKHRIKHPRFALNHTRTKLKRRTK